MIIINPLHIPCATLNPMHFIAKSAERFPGNQIAAAKNPHMLKLQGVHNNIIKDKRKIVTETYNCIIIGSTLNSASFLYFIGALLEP